MERYLLFSGEAHYPCGGANDLQGSYATMVECIQAAPFFGFQWWNVLDTHTGRVYNYHEVEFKQRLEWAAGIDAGEDI